MPRKEPRDYKAEYASYHGKPQQRKNRSQRTLDGRAAKKAGKVRPGQEVDHVKPLSKAPVTKAKTGARKTRVVSKAANRRKGNKGL